MNLNSEVGPDWIKFATVLKCALKDSKPDRRKSPTVNIPEALNNGIEGPLFSIWKSHIERALRINDDHHRGEYREESRRHVVESNVTGISARLIAQGLETGR